MSVGLFYHQTDDLPCHVAWTNRISGSHGERLAHSFLIIICVTIKHMIDLADSLFVDTFSVNREVMMNKLWVFRFFNDIKTLYICTIIKGACRVKEHLFKQMAFTACKDKLSAVHLLDMRAKQCLNVLFWIICNLLEFVNGHDTLLASILQRTENLFQWVSRILYLTNGNTKSGEGSNWVKANLTHHGAHSGHNHFLHFLPSRGKCIKNSLT